MKTGKDTLEVIMGLNFYMTKYEDGELCRTSWNAADSELKVVEGARRFDNIASGANGGIVGADD